MIDVLSTRALNRTLLQRQFLVDRTSRPVLDVVEHLVALQAQEPNWPYLGLWTRVAGFRTDDLAELLRDGRVVRSTILRCTQHLASGSDFHQLRRLIQPVLDRTSRAARFTATTGDLNLAELLAAGRELTTGRTVRRRELARALAERFPGHDGRVLAGAVELRIPMVHDHATAAWGTWGTRSNVSVTPAEHLLGPATPATPSAPLAPPPADRPAGPGSSDDSGSSGSSDGSDGSGGSGGSGASGIEPLVLRYLAAFGPAGVKDLQTWSGLTRLRGVLDAMRSRLRVFRDEHGTELFDLPEAVIAPADLPLPVRFLPAFDNLLLGHADRTRVLADPDRRLVMPGRAMVHPTFLVDGFVHGSWSLKGGTLRITPFRPLSAADAREVRAEAERLLAFAAPGADGAEVVLD
ncbi:winged helix DNA-binding domain-containing protein [Kitasatospora sp. NPDC088134]|uniref:winged helix DNA-binding domain-containing protein n=1 Tax=Kitasatospora sp. NPDC088134 TaxID=3364071 RepID=UPI003820CF3C